jgi:hypothetical protein
VVAVYEIAIGPRNSDEGGGLKLEETFEIAGRQGFEFR